jgi:PKD repeat protein
MRIAAPGALAVLIMATSGCSVGEQSAPPLSGPSSLGLSVTLAATPDRMVRDGTSKSTISAVVHDATGKPVAGLPLEWAVTPSDNKTFIEPSWRFSTTDANGTTTVQITAPAPPTELPPSPLVLTVTATPLSTDTGNAVPRLVTVQLVSPDGTLPPNNLPVPSFIVSPSTAMITRTVSVDASATTDEGVACIDRCTYRWDFGDGGTGSGRLASYVYTTAGVKTITLTATDSRGGSDTTTGTVTITAPAAPVAVLTASPSTALINTEIAFDASGSTVGFGATIVKYTFVWGDGSGNTDSTSPHARHAFSRAGTYIVRAIVTDSLARTATATANVTITVPAAPTAGFVVSPASTKPINTPVFFDAAGSTVGQGATIVKHTWVWGDGSANTETSASQTTHSFGQAGIYVVRLIVTDSLDRTATVIASVTIG